MTDEDAGLRSSKDRFRSDFAVVCAGYLAGQGILRLFIGFLIGVNDKPRAELLVRWLPFWNALGFFIAAWGVHRLILWFRLPRFGSTTPLPSAVVPQAREVALESPGKTAKTIDADWKARIKAAQKRKDVDAILDIRQSLDGVLPAARAKSVDHALGKWFTKHFQRMMLSGRAAESLPAVERVADHFAGSEEFAYFEEILPVVRQCASIVASVKEEKEADEKA